MNGDLVLQRAREAFARAAPHRRTSLERAIERAFWGARPHAAARHCPLCGRGADEVVLVADLRDHCDRCLRICYGTVVEARVGQSPPPWEMVLAETARAFRGEFPDALAALEARVLGRDDPPGPCARCGEIGRWPRADAEGDLCGVCRRGRGEAGIVVAGPTDGLCQACVEAGQRLLLRPR